jgi:hypothetical protein
MRLQDEVNCMRISTKRHEIVISPGTCLRLEMLATCSGWHRRSCYLLAVLQSPTT